MANGVEQAAPAPGQAPAEGGGAQEGDLSSLVQNLTSGMQIFSEVVGAGAAQIGNEQLAQRVQALNAEFQAVSQEAIQGAQGGQPPAQGGQGLASPEAGTAAVRPAGPAG
jgi:hypothetical protein